MKVRLIIKHKRGNITCLKESESVDKAKRDWLNDYINKQTKILDVYSVPLSESLKMAKVTITHEIIR